MYNFPAAADAGIKNNCSTAAFFFNRCNFFFNDASLLLCDHTNSLMQQQLKQKKITARYDSSLYFCCTTVALAFVQLQYNLN